MNKPQITGLSALVDAQYSFEAAAKLALQAFTLLSVKIPHDVYVEELHRKFAEGADALGYRLVAKEGE